MTATGKHPTWYILGAGAIGTLWACYWRQAGFPVVMITRNRRDSLPVSLRASVNIEINVEWISVAELLSVKPAITHLLVSTKAQQTLDAVTAILPCIAADATVLILQNGMAGQQLPALLPTQTLITGITSDGAFMEDTNTVVHAGKGITYIGSDASLLSYLPMQALDIRPCQDIRAKQWRKLAVNCAINGLTAIYHCRNGALLTHPEAMPRIKKVCVEVVAVANAVGVDVSSALNNIENDVIKTLTDTAENYSSLYQDIAHRRTTEIDFINGYIIALAEQHDISCDENRAIVAAVKMLEPD